jgi:aspartokinase/homoserine dehydrogenase 1
MKVLKFGGSSVAKPERIRNIVEILKSYYAEGEHFTVVFSAFGGVTDMLIEMSQLAASGKETYQDLFDEFSDRHSRAVEELLREEYKKDVLPQLDRNHEVLRNLLHGIFLVREASPRTMDYVLSFGERNAAFIISYVLQQAGVKSAYLDARKIIKTDKKFNSAKVDFELTYQKIREYYTEHPEVQIVTGFIASAKGGLTTTLGRGGSDYTASLIAAGLNAKVIEIWTDVDGVLTADPRKVKKAFTIKNMTYAEAMEMSHFGAKVIYPPTLQPALQKQIPLYIKNTFNPTFRGTYISSQSDPDGAPVKGISSVSQIALLTLSGSGLFGVPGIAARLFGALAQANINIILITQGSSEHSISFAVEPQAARKAKRQVETAFQYELDREIVDPVKIEEDLSVVAIIGENMRYRTGISGRLFQALGKNGINIIAIAQGSSELNISVVIPQSDETKALNALHEAFFLSGTQELHLFMVGVGLIGSTLLKQLKAQTVFLKEKRSLEIKVVGLANTKKMIFDKDGIDLENWQSTLAEGDTVSDLPIFIARMKEMNLTNSIFIDNTANEKVASYYESILEHSISISTPNKIATSSSFLQYQRLKTIASKRGVAFRYETNVGAGLPVISTLNDLIGSGDEILQIQGVLSGSLSYIFNNFTGDQPFSEIVAEAKKLGYTEPDPRIDLSGMDVRRKILILAREVGWPLEQDDVKVASILPPAVEAAAGVDEFFAQLANHNDHFENLRATAEADDKVLRMIASLDESGKARIALEAVDIDSPFYFLSGSDNMIVFVTARYQDRPLVVRGPGAGAEVTAAGVFAEIISIGKFLF